MPMAKPTPAALAAFDAAIPDDDPRAERKPMFGMPAAFVNGNMFLGVFDDGLVLRLPDARRGELSELDDAGPFEPMPGRPWKEYIHASASRLPAERLAQWAAEALAHTAGLPPKAKKASKKPA